MINIIENIVIGKADLDLYHLFAYNEFDWGYNEFNKTLFTAERYLPQLLVNVGIAKSTSEVRKNRPELVKVLEKRDFLKLKWGKKYIFIAVFPQ